MGLQVTAANVNDKKADFTIATVLGAAPPAIAAGQAMIWVGNLTYGRQTEIHARLQQLIEEGRESSWRQSGAPNEETYEILIGDAKSLITKTNGAAIPALTEDQVALAWDETLFVEDSTLIFQQLFTRMREALMEEELKAR